MNRRAKPNSTALDPSRPMAVEIDKPESRKGTYLYPAGFTKTEPGAGAKPAAAGAAR